MKVIILPSKYKNIKELLQSEEFIAFKFKTIAQESGVSIKCKISMVERFCLIEKFLNKSCLN